MIVNLLLYFLFLSGVLLTEFPLVRGTFAGIFYRLRIRRDLMHREDAAPYRSYGPFLTHIQKLLESTHTGSFVSQPAHFVTASCILGAGAFFSLYWIEGLGFSLMTGLLAAALPYLGLRLKLHRGRAMRSREGDIMMRELLSCYKIRDCNMKEAVEAAAAGLEGAPNAKRLLYDLANGFNRSYTREDIRRELELFRYSLATSWGGALTQVIYFAMVQGIRVTESLEDLTRSLMQSREVIENAKRENSEAALMLKYLAPGCYLLSVFLACRFFRFTPARFLQYQFGTALGLQWFIIMIGAYLLGVLADGFLSREKMDI